jgi:lysophospholipase L1-like esterase
VSRNRSYLHRALAALLFLGLLVVGAPASSAEATPLRVLLTGDSIVQGFHGDFTWRYRLYQEFVRQGVPVNFVGSKSAPTVKPGYTTSQYLDPAFDRDHFAVTGSTLRQHAAWVADEVAGQQPDVIVLHCGINDLRNGASPETTRDRLLDWIRAVRRVRPDVPIVVSPVLQAIDLARPTLAQRIDDYNALARDLVGSSSGLGPITFADTTRGWSVTAHTAENLHPNPTGETLIAQRIAETLHGLDYLPQAPDLYRYTSWNRQPRVKVTFKDQRAVLTWDAQALSGARVWIKRAGYAAYYPTRVYGGSTMTTSPLVPRATYDIRVGLVRGRLQSPVGPATRVVAPVPPRPVPVARVLVNATGVSWTRSSLATQYQVKFKRVRTKRWVTVHTTRLAFSARRVARAKVWAVNASGRSAYRLGVR